MAEEKESLRRQIQLLQGLINSHKIIHGDAPANPRWQPPAQPCGGYRQPNPSSWRKKYSLVNRTSQAADASAVSAGESGARKVPSAIGVSEKLGQTTLSGNKDKPADASAFKWQSAAAQGGRARPKPSVTASVPSTSVSMGPRPLDSGGHKEILRGASKTQQKVSWTPLNRSSPAQVPAAAQPPFKKTPVSLPKTEVNCAPPKPSAASSHRTPSAPQKSNETSKSQKAKYIWVADSRKAPPAAKKVSPRRASAEEKSLEATAAVKGKKNGANPKASALKSRYKWKAESLVSSQEAPVTPALQRGAPRPSSATPQHSKAPAVMAAAASFRSSPHSGYKVKSKTKIIRRRSTSRSPADKKSPEAPLMVKSRYSLRRRSSPRMKSPSTVKRSSPRGLVHISKHRLRRLPPPGKQQPSPTREGPSPSSLRSPPSSRVIKTRYRIVKRSTTPPLVTSPFSTLSSSLNWRTRLILLNRLRQNQTQQRWRSRGLCFIGGVMYRVSANKLSKTWSPGSGSKLTPKTGKLDVSSTSPGSMYPSRPATPSRYIASRAIQRSLAIIRHAQHKKEKKEYCMYYNRFGKCNRGQKCPYIHDPEKVAVCTRFLRGTCKKTDGSCPFSHQVSKDKMPVCSYFLKGICRNNDCPYSHVYVSRKAEVCQDFLKGYCPMGAKCKKKHTLLCLDYARDGKCPQGSKCKLQHRQRKKRMDAAAQSEQMPTSAKHRRRSPDQAGCRMSPVPTRVRDHPSTSDEQLPGSSGLQSCPSFISLNCSSASEGTPASERVKSSETTGKPLQIKPRL
ncbi:zinc finger CCCH domain-containing protein 3 isoform X2 [Bufo bufo]|uniref:zinc finger CCCH domain-containing protein 3 isoform X2 n=1 Tax=Bufo bufo TaxID=8384 RepID=UPI001ABE07BA|nr:zinc finger CCCH domain-containing protein 3 isoform X2 [Bufo bufo]